VALPGGLGVRVVHSTPHRVRVAVEGLKHQPTLARQLEARLLGAPGVRDATANTITGTVVVSYEDGWDWRDDPQTLASSLAAGAPESQVQALAVHLTVMASGSQSAGSAVGSRILLPLALGLLGGRELLTLADVAVPRWYDFLWLAIGAYPLLGTAGASAVDAGERAAKIGIA
jgi:hypothetical protein